MYWIQTRDGKVLDLASPSPDAIDPVTLGVVLSRMCRFGGHSQEFYSVAQHSVLVCDLVQFDGLKLPALLHDAHEAYWGFGDILRPAKYLLGFSFSYELGRHQAVIDLAIARRFGLSSAGVFRDAIIKEADNLALATEVRDVMEHRPGLWEQIQLPDPHPDHIKPWDVGEAYRQFMSRLSQLCRTNVLSRKGG